MELKLTDGILQETHANGEGKSLSYYSIELEREITNLYKNIVNGNRQLALNTALQVNERSKQVIDILLSNKEQPYLEGDGTINDLITELALLNSFLLTADNKTHVQRKIKELEIKIKGLTHE